MTAREERVHHLKDDKILTSWNGLMIAVLTLAAKALGEMAQSSAQRKTPRPSYGKHCGRERASITVRDGDVAIEGFLEDNAFLAWGLLELYEASLEVEYLERAVALHKKMMSEFWDTEKGLGPSRELVIVGKRDNPTLSGTIGKIHTAFTPHDVLVFYDPDVKAATRLCSYLNSYPHPKRDFDIYVCKKWDVPNFRVRPGVSGTGRVILFQNLS